MSFAATVRRTIVRGVTVAIDGEVIPAGGGKLITPAHANNRNLDKLNDE